jgi:hypothetical protein
VEEEEEEEKKEIGFEEEPFQREREGRGRRRPPTWERPISLLTERKVRRMAFFMSESVRSSTVNL